MEQGVAPKEKRTQILTSSPLQVALASVPEEVRGWFGSEKVTRTLMELNERLGLRDEKRSIIPRVLLRLEVRDLPPEDFINTIAEELDIAPMSAKSITHEIKEIILEPIKSSLDDWEVNIDLIDVSGVPAGIKLPKIKKPIQIEKKPIEPRELAPTTKDPPPSHKASALAEATADKPADAKTSTIAKALVDNLADKMTDNAEVQRPIRITSAPPLSSEAPVRAGARPIQPKPSSETSVEITAPKRKDTPRLSPEAKKEVPSPDKPLIIHEEAGIRPVGIGKKMRSGLSPNLRGLGKFFRPGSKKSKTPAPKVKIETPSFAKATEDKSALVPHFAKATEDKKVMADKSEDKPAFAEASAGKPDKIVHYNKQRTLPPNERRAHLPPAAEEFIDLSALKPAEKKGEEDGGKKEMGVGLEGNTIDLR